MNTELWVVLVVVVYVAGVMVAAYLIGLVDPDDDNWEWVCWIWPLLVVVLVCIALTEFPGCFHRLGVKHSKSATKEAKQP